ncbi:DUF3148 domain-containing protein [Cyanobacterium aponinum AL20118]|uniref:DUF3148 domain-containing protein n=1 Tax=Cyanobacterium aponinum AL20115 TaxID=3090662 RepID=A0AAF0Z951_9CHRO|nr:DUF3148 domain-containing protein [Cyanobacterium aponinum]MBD2394203.1 DUF3148 domain-containing protein [Cyanobacterium aponinum FACHB-4101]WPF87678.1 DUF3148 domain-containing protein [Cyanobacterium aponinum AL20115]
MEKKLPIFKTGDRVKIIALPPYLKTADPMPMLRPNSAIALGEEGIIIKQNFGGYYSIRFTQGAYLLESKYIALADN